MSDDDRDPCQRLRKRVSRDGTRDVGGQGGRVTAFAGAVTGSFALPAQVPSMWDLFLPLLIAVAEFMLFAVLVPQVAGLTTERAALTFWFYAMAAFALLAAAAIIRARVVFRYANYAHDLHAGISWYSRRLGRDTAGASATAAFGIACGTLSIVYPDQVMLIAFSGAGLIAGGLVAAIASHGRTAARWCAILTPPQAAR